MFFISCSLFAIFSLKKMCLLLSINKILYVNPKTCKWNVFENKKLWKEEKNSLCPLSNLKPKFEKGLRVIFLFLVPNFQHPMLKVKSKLSFFMAFRQVQSSNQGTLCIAKRKEVDVAFTLWHWKLARDEKKNKKKQEYRNKFFLGNWKGKFKIFLNFFFSFVEENLLRVPSWVYFRPSNFFHLFFFFLFLLIFLSWHLNLVTKRNLIELILVPK